MQDIQRDPLTFLRRVEAGESFLVIQRGAYPGGSPAGANA